MDKNYYFEDAIYLYIASKKSKIPLQRAQFKVLFEHKRIQWALDDQYFLQLLHERYDAIAAERSGTNKNFRLAVIECLALFSKGTDQSYFTHEFEKISQSIKVNPENFFDFTIEKATNFLRHFLKSHSPTHPMVLRLTNPNLGNTNFWLHGLFGSIEGHEGIVYWGEKSQI